MYDLVVRNGLVVDGRGTRATRADVAVVDGKIAAIGTIDGESRAELDANGHVVAPGFIDIHTHYDVQLFWDPTFSVSSWHGVTSVVMGNCGFGVAPLRPAHREMMLKTLENVEGMDYDVTSTGLGPDWGAETFGGYLDDVAAAKPRLNVGSFVGHTAVRTFVMGREASERPATPTEIGQMAAVVREAMEEGALGFSTSNSPGHFGLDNKPVPSRFADWQELMALVGAVAVGGHGMFMTNRGPITTIEHLRKIARAWEIPISMAGIAVHAGHKGRHQRLIDGIESLARDGVDIHGQVAPRPLTLEFSMTDPYMLILDSPGEMGLPTLDELFEPALALDHAGRLKAFASKSFREQFIEQTDSRPWHDVFWRTTFVTANDADPASEGHRVGELARDRGCHPAEIILDMALETDLTARFSQQFQNENEEEVERILLHPLTRLGLSDAGAHASQICDGCYPTYLLGRWVRERRSMSLEKAVAMLTRDEANAFGITDRGELSPGFAADIVVFDPDTVAAGPLRRVHDLPAGGERLVSDAVGIDAIVVNGTIVRQDNVDLVASGTGRILRNGVGGTYAR